MQNQKQNKRVIMTRQRKVILRELRKTLTHPTADEIYGMVRKRLPKISLGTVYRNLEMLSENGVIRKLDVAGNQRRYDGRMEEHHHVRCIKCGKVSDLSAKPVINIEREFKDPGGFIVRGYSLEFRGVCPDCGKQDPEPREH